MQTLEEKYLWLGLMDLTFKQLKRGEMLLVVHTALCIVLLIPADESQPVSACLLK